MAARELRRYRTKGPGVTAKFLRVGIPTAGLPSGPLIDVGAGVGAFTFELLERGISRATAVDASAAYLAAAKQEAVRRGRSESTELVHGDFTQVSTQLPIADLVTLDRVVCCYLQYEPLLDGALRHASRGFAFSYPRDRWFVRLAVRLENVIRRARSNPFRTVVHPVTPMQRMIRDAA